MTLATAPVEINLHKTPVATHEKPGPDRGEENRVEEDYPLQNLTEGNLADNEWDDRDYTYTVNHSEKNPQGRRTWRDDRFNSKKSESDSDYVDSRESNEWEKPEVNEESEVKRLRKQLESLRTDYERKLSEKNDEIKKKKIGKVDGVTTAPPPKSGNNH